MVRPPTGDRGAGDPVADPATAIAMRFGGDAALYHAFAAECAIQFVRDIEQGQAACAAGDLAELARLAHNLKSALTMLGHDNVSRLAGRVEAQASAGARSAALEAWQALRAVVQGLTPGRATR